VTSLIAIAQTALVAWTAAAGEPQRACPRSDTYCLEMQRIVANSRVRRAVEFFERTDAAALRELVALTQVPAPPFKESERAKRFAEMMRAAGADSVAIDEVGNVIALRRGVRRMRRVGIAGHMDTVFPEGTDVRVKQRGDTLFAPGVGDNTRGLIAMLQAMRALVHAGIRTDADIVFIGTVGEEGLGDLRGMKHVFRAGAQRIDAVIAVDASGDEAITNSAIGSKRYRVTFNGPGGHSWSSFGAANPIHALSRAIRKFDDAAARFTATAPATTYSVGRIGGGTAVNAIPAQAWAEVDLRSANPTLLGSLDSIFHTSMVDALNEQNAVRTTGAELTLEARMIGDRPSGSTPATAPLVLRAMAATRALGLVPRLEESSTDANVPISRAIPAITISRGGEEGRAHSTDEWWMNAHGTRALRRLLYVVLAEAGLR
jgi:tripeptide aminopeptidase